MVVATDNLPREIYQLIFENLDIRSYLNARHTCRRWYYICRDKFVELSMARKLQQALVNIQSRQGVFPDDNGFLNHELWQQCYGEQFLSLVRSLMVSLDAYLTHEISIDASLTTVRQAWHSKLLVGKYLYDYDPVSFKPSKSQFRFFLYDLSEGQPSMIMSATLDSSPVGWAISQDLRYFAVCSHVSLKVFRVIDIEGDKTKGKTVGSVVYESLTSREPHVFHNIRFIHSSPSCAILWTQSYTDTRFTNIATGHHIDVPHESDHNDADPNHSISQIYESMETDLRAMDEQPGADDPLCNYQDFASFCFKSLSLLDITRSNYFCFPKRSGAKWGAPRIFQDQRQGFVKAYPLHQSCSSHSCCSVSSTTATTMPSPRSSNEGSCWTPCGVWDLSRHKNSGYSMTCPSPRRFVRRYGTYATIFEISSTPLSKTCWTIHADGTLSRDSEEYPCLLQNQCIIDS